MEFAQMNLEELNLEELKSVDVQNLDDAQKEELTKLVNELEAKQEQEQQQEQQQENSNNSLVSAKDLKDLKEQLNRGSKTTLIGRNPNYPGESPEGVYHVASVKLIQIKQTDGTTKTEIATSIAKDVWTSSDGKKQSMEFINCRYGSNTISLLNDMDGIVLSSIIENIAEKQSLDVYFRVTGRDKTVDGVTVRKRYAEFISPLDVELFELKPEKYAMY